MKTTENYEQLLQRFTKRVNQLETEQQELRAAYDRWIELDKQLDQNKDLYKKWSDRQKSYEDERNKDNKNKKNLIDPTGGVGGAKESIKCLHSHTADELSTGKNAIGKIVVESIGSFNCEEVCINPKTFEKNKNWKVIW